VAEPDWAPRCERCGEAYLRTNVEIFNDNRLVLKRLEQQKGAFRQHDERAENFARDGEVARSLAVDASAHGRQRNWVTLEVSAVPVSPSIRSQTGTAGSKGQYLNRINPSLGQYSSFERESCAFAVWHSSTSSSDEACWNTMPSCEPDRGPIADKYIQHFKRNVNNSG
jgi:hypothetical protein